MEHSDYSCKAYCPWLDESPTSLRIIDSQTQPRQKAIPKKMKKLIDGDLAAISGKRSTKDRLKEKLRQKQEAKDQHFKETGNKDVAAPTDVEQKSRKQKKRRKRSKKALALYKQENEAMNEDAKQIESKEKIQVEESGKTLDGEISIPVDNKVNADTLLAEIEKPDGELSVHIDNEINADTLLAEIEKLTEEISVLVNNEVCSDTLLAEIEKLDGDISEPIEVNANIILAGADKLSEEISVPIGNKLKADTLLAEIKKLDGEISVPIDNEINAEALSAVMEKLKEEISNLVNNKVNVDTLLADSEKLDVEISEPIDNKVNTNILLAEIEKLSGEISVPLDYELNIETLSAEIQKLGGEISAPIDHKVNAYGLLAAIKKLSEKISELIDNEGNVDALLAEIDKLSTAISEPVDHQMNTDTFLLEIEKLVREFSVPNDNHVDANPHLADIEMPDTEIDVHIDNLSREIFVHTDYKINADKLYAEIEKLCCAKPVHVDNKLNTDTLLAEEENLDGEIFPLVDNKLNADKHVAEIVKFGEVLPVPNDNKINADTLLAEIKKLDGETSTPAGIKINAYTLLGEIEKLSEEISVLVDSKTNVDTLLAGIEKLSREISEPTDNKVNNDILLAEVEKFGGTIAVPVYNELNADTFLAEIQMLEGDISVSVNKEGEISSPRENKLNANTLLAKTEKDKITKAAQGASKKFSVSGQFRKKITPEKYSIIADNLDNKLSRNHKVEISMPERKKLIGNMKSEVEQLRKKRKSMPDKIQSCINMEILCPDVSQRLEANKVDILSPEMIKYLAVPTTARLGCESGFELYSAIPSQPSITKQQLAAKLSGPDCMLIKEVHQVVLHMHLEEKTYTCLENFKQKSITQIKMKQSPLVNEIPECEIKYCPVFSISQVISDSTPHTQVISNTLERKEKERLLLQNLMDSQELRDHFTKIMILVDDARKTGFLFIEGILNQMKKMSKIGLEVVKWPDISNSVFMPQKGLSHLFILYCDSGPGLFDFLATLKIHGLPNTCMSEEKNCSSEKFLLARMRQRFVLTIFCLSATGRRPALSDSILVRSWAGPVDFAQSDLQIYSTVEVKENALKVLKPWVKMKTKIIMNIHSTLQNIRTRQKPAAVEMVELCRKASMIESKITFESHDNKIQLSVNDAGQFNYTDMLNDMVSRYMFLQGQQEVLTVLETHTSQRGRKAQFMNFKIPITMTGSLIKPVFNKRFVENVEIVQHFEDLDGSAEHKNLVKGSITYIHRKNGKSFKGNMDETDFEIKIREKSKFRGSSLQRGDFHLNKKVNTLVAYKKREESVHVAAISNLHVSRKEKNLTIRCHDDGLKEIQKYNAFDIQTATKTTAIEAARKYIVKLHEEISKKLAVKQQTETVKILPLNINIFPRYARRHELLKLRNSDRGVTAEPVQETNSKTVESMSIYDDNTPCSQINDEAPGQIHEHSENINIFDNLEQTHYGIRLCMFG